MEFGRRKIQHGGEGVPVWLGDGVQSAVVAVGAPGAVLRWYHMERRRPWRVETAGTTSSFQGAKFRLGDFKFVWIQAACGKNWAAGGLYKMANAMAWPWSPLAIADNAGKRSQNPCGQPGRCERWTRQTWRELRRRCDPPVPKKKQTKPPGRRGPPPPAGGGRPKNQRLGFVRNVEVWI